MSASDQAGRVMLAPGCSALSQLHQLLNSAIEAYPQAFIGAPLPTVDRLRKSYAQYLPCFEAARLASEDRVKIAAVLSEQMQAALLWQEPSGAIPLTEALQADVEPLALRSHRFSGDPGGWQPNLEYAGRSWDTAEIPELADYLLQRNTITRTAAQALKNVVRHGLDDGLLDLSGRRIAVLGAGAEMASTRIWLAAGADVLWLDTRPPPADLLSQPDLSGQLFWSDEPTDLLSNPQQVLAQLKSFAQDRALDLCLYAYAPGQARELLLTGTMNAIVDTLADADIATVNLLVSPTTPTQLDQEACEIIQKTPQLWWQRICLSLGLIGREGGTVQASGQADVTVCNAIVPIQGSSYQAAQYIGKVMTAIRWSAHRRLVVSANTAAITQTRSLTHPIFNAAFGGAAAFGVSTMTPEQSRRLNGLLMVADWLQPEAIVLGEVRVHGGIHTLPYPLRSALNVAALIGFVRAPSLLLQLLRR